MLRFQYGGTRNLQVNKQTHVSILVANHVCDSIKNASSMGALLIPKLQYISAGIYIC
jgi:hypothetical protein